ncbi:MAG: ornithine cyclodeaminase family protein [Thermoplasmata archaeon]|nr:ornithine cyclodeaminase family protein [Thermoplasmata archaeon]
MSDEMLYLSRADVERVDLPMAEVIDAVERVFVEKGEGRVEMPPKPGIHTMPDAFIHAMPAYIPGMKAAGMKWVSGYPANHGRGLPYISGLLVLNDPETGIPVSVMDATWITAMRTAAATAVAAKHLALPGSHTLGILGCGVQGRTNLEALKVAFPAMDEVKAYDIDRSVVERYSSEMSDEHDVRVSSVSSPADAVKGCDMVVTAGPILKHPTPAIEPGWLMEGGFACPLDFDSYWRPGAMQAVDKFVTDDVSQLDYYRTVGYFGGIPEVYADLGEIVSGKKPGRERPEERIMSMNLGVAIEDMGTAVRLFERAKSSGIGQWLSL